ncbi:tRNA (adenosine(37)-N6)-threonylcarbamoyltransferase complex ATPase subunit type 1 TsaE [Candidatus Phytoplasma solani]|uniref:tRNA threonylcarbamoyladenosine biosynthesis protein TsaE n=1 Tax=Candidatus Phytoplasma solani TaxID=69896 RepID=A0A421NUW1_9MOLU|nr:tRNA (adenosine(37)-N6)-threonylcarbamoyltransferase complex ATPase subunit type 1 TsaE [Candidatus Phytoplasma solani]RMI87803.1 tRNA threonylcarbamoyladenosine biosynthesis protein TsaE [Candidatus Phytoplasma solani]CCP88139.1 predicted ATPase [Candidatus Phytoplasma solani]CCP88864.1 conserved hypothetical protein [Candidatus Phytoplasma solani]
MIHLETITHSFLETKKLGFWLGQKLTPRTDKTIILLQGTLGSGKTAFAKGLISSLGVKQIVNSPTFVIVKTYFTSLRNIYHLDLYRATLECEFLEELLENFVKPDFLIVEFLKDCSNYFPDFDVLVKINSLNEKKRQIIIQQKAKINNI